MTGVNWNEIARQAPCELVLSGDQIATQVEKDQGKLDDVVYGIKSLNFLDITDTPTLKCISDKIISLSNLTNLVLRGNKLSEIPAEIGSLKKLKCLDLSRNQISELPADIFKDLTCLQILNLEQNSLEYLPLMNKLESLISFKFGSNKIKDFPSSLCNGIYKKPESQGSTIAICGGGAVHLAEIYASHNLIEALPYRIHRLVALKTLDLSFNKITVVPSELADCSKLKDLNLKENPMKDRRFYKMIDQCISKKVIEYIRSNCKSGKGSPGEEPEEGDANQDEAAKKEEERAKMNNIVVQHHAQIFRVKVTKQILPQRKIVACILKNVDLTNIKVLKKFIQIQTKLHQGICDNRQKATIATHDLSKMLPPPITFATKLGQKSEQQAAVADEKAALREAYFDGRVPTKIKLVPLGRASEMTAQQLYRMLNDEADQYRKEKKRNTISGIHKYLHLLKGKQYYPVLLDYSQANALSLPPLTNSEYSRINSTTKDVFVEITGQTIPDCRAVMNEFIKLVLDLDVKEDENEEAAHMVNIDNGQATLYIEPVVVQSFDDDQLIVKFPSKIDLQFSDVNVKVDN